VRCGNIEARDATNSSAFCLISFWVSFRSSMQVNQTTALTLFLGFVFFSCIFIFFYFWWSYFECICFWNFAYRFFTICL